MLQVEGCKDQSGKLPISLAEVLVIAGVAVVLVGDSLGLLDLADGVRDVDLVLLEVDLQVAVHRELEVHGLLLQGDCGVGAAA